MTFITEDKLENILDKNKEIQSKARNLIKKLLTEKQYAVINI